MESVAHIADANACLAATSSSILALERAESKVRELTLANQQLLRLVHRQKKEVQKKELELENLHVEKELELEKFHVLVQELQSNQG